MEKKYKLDEQLCIYSLSVRDISYNNAHHFEMKNRKVHNSFGFILEGSADFSTLTDTVSAKTGDLIFIPEGIRYVSHWNGAPNVHFYSLDFLMPKKSANMWQNMRLQRIDGVDNEKIYDVMNQMCELSAKGEQGQFAAFGLFYSMLSTVLPHIAVNEEQALPPLLEAAVAYIDANYATISSVKEIAAACFLSESRLYHLFREHLDTSPVSYLNNIRIHAAIELLANPNLSIQEIAEMLNFHSEYYFRKTFKRITGDLPSRFRKIL